MVINKALAFAGVSALALQSFGLGATAPFPTSDISLLSRIFPIALLMTLSFGALGLYSAHQRAKVKGVVSRVLIAFGCAFAGLGVLY